MEDPVFAFVENDDIWPYALFVPMNKEMDCYAVTFSGHCVYLGRHPIERFANVLTDDRIKFLTKEEIPEKVYKTFQSLSIMIK